MQDEVVKNSEHQQSAVSLNFQPKQTLTQRVLGSFSQGNWRTFVLLTVLMIVLYWVTFVLPHRIEQPNVEVDAKTFIAKENTKPIEDSPWRDSQLAKYRKEAQDILSNVLEKQNELEQKRVELWAKSAFTKALQTAEQGDLFYRNQEFDSAIASYHQALNELIAIENLIDELHQGQLTKGLNAINDNSAVEAKEALQLAMYLKPEDVEANQLFDRAIVLDKVLSLIAEAKILVEERQWQQAKLTVDKALELDSNSPLASQLKEEISGAIIERNFSTAMSKGFKLLEQRQYEQAIALFKQAQKISPNNPVAQQAITQSENEKLLAETIELMAQASKHVEREQWYEAWGLYEQVLTLDASIIDARVGSIKAKVRNELAQALIEIIEKPHRLANQTVYYQAQQSYKDALAIADKGEVLLKQITAVENILSQMKVPISITVKSDNQTKVTLFRSGELGQFLQKEIKLAPGEYTLVGTRDGYRDVRRDFVLAPNAQSPTIVIQCQERITRG